MKMLNLGSPIAQDHRGDKGSCCTLLKARRLNVDKYWGKEGVVPPTPELPISKVNSCKSLPFHWRFLLEDWLNLYTPGLTKLSKLGLQRHRLGHPWISRKSDARKKTELPQGTDAFHSWLFFPSTYKKTDAMEFPQLRVERRGKSRFVPISKE